MTTVTIELNITDQHCADIMCTALEGGIGYWAQARNIQRKPGEHGDDYVSCELAELYDAESAFDWSKPLRLDYSTIRTGIERICRAEKYERTASGIIEDIRTDSMGCNIDANVADVIVQFGLFNEERYA